MKALHLLFFLLLVCLQSTGQNQDHGLHIRSYPLQMPQFTSMALEDGRLIRTKGEELTLNFHLWVRNENVFGTVFRIITDKEKNIDLLYSVSENDKRFPILVTGDVVHPLQKEVRRETWVPVRLTLSPEDGAVSLEYDSTLIVANDPELKGVAGVRISFGLCPFDKFTLADVASVNIKNVALSRGETLIRYWEMARHHGDICYDNLVHAPASGKNTSWIIDQYITWKPVYTRTFSSSPSIAFDAETGVFYMATNKKELYKFDTQVLVEHLRTETVSVHAGEYAANYPNQLIYIPGKRRLLSYNLDENIYSFFDFEGRTWQSDRVPTQEHDYWNNTLVYNPADSTLVSFGGYGHYHYNNQLLICHPWAPGKPQRRLTLTNIHPRYSCASVIVDSTLYIFGGRGCPSGRQELSPRNYYDLYAVNLLTQQVNKLWEIPETPEGGDFQPGENMVYDKKNDCFYFFCGQGGGTLMKIDARTPSLQPMSLPIGLKLEAQYIYTNLYYSPKQEKLYAAIQQSDVNGKSQVDIYVLHYPPVSVKEFEQPGAVPGYPLESSAFRWLVWIGSAVLIVAGSFFYYKRKTGKRAVSQSDPVLTKGEKHGRTDKPAEGTTETGENARLQKDFDDLREVPLANLLPETKYYDFSSKCICLFGGFRVFDREGNDMTASFTPTLKSLLILLILYTGKNTKGISSHLLINTLWYDKTEESAKNNRNVYMSKLRALLDKAGDIKIVNQNGLWSIRFGEGTLCDYLEAIRLFQENKSRELNKLLELLFRGILLPNMETDWIDKFKSDFSNTTIDLLCRLLQRADLSDSFKLKIADTLFQHDYISEEALCAKCSILSRQGKNGLAKTVYDAFCKEYAASLGTEYKHSLMEIIGKANQNR